MAKNQDRPEIVSMMKTISVPLEKALAEMKLVEPNGEIVQAARAIGTTFGDSA